MTVQNIESVKIIKGHKKAALTGGFFLAPSDEGAGLPLGKTEGEKIEGSFVFLHFLSFRHG